MPVLFHLIYLYIKAIIFLYIIPRRNRVADWRRHFIMILTIKSESLTVEIEDAGAQLASVRDNKSGVQYIWQGDPNIWARRAPLLFPVIARLRDNQYTFDGKTWNMPIHGFCRSAPFTVREQSETSVSFAYSDNDETRKSYPFAFHLTVTYSIKGRVLTKRHKIENRSKIPMLYELGGHDGFRAPLAVGETMDDYSIHIPGLTSITPYGMDAANMITPKTKTFNLTDGKIQLKPSVYNLDTVILDNLPQRKAVLTDKQNRPRVTMEFKDFPYLGIWTAAKDFDTNYVCIEPWTTLPDAVFAGRDLSEKIGVRALEPGKTDTLSYTTTFQ